jgi:hypothetical protein
MDDLDAGGLTWTRASIRRAGKTSV